MSDLLDILPRFPVSSFSTLLPVLDRHNITVTDLLVLETSEVGKRTKLPLLDIKRLTNALVASLHKDLGISAAPLSSLSSASNNNPNNDIRRAAANAARHTKPVPGPLNQPPPTYFISTLDPDIDAALGGGIPIGSITEITGESGVGKTQLLLSLLLAVQLPPPHGLGRPALYMSTEASLPTTRLEQILEQNSVLKEARKVRWANGSMFQDLDDDDDDDGHYSPKRRKISQQDNKIVGNLTYPSTDDIFSAETSDLESQEHILTYQVPVQIERNNAGLLILDSVAANFRAEFERRDGTGGGGDNGRATRGEAKNNPQTMAARSSKLIQLGFLLHDLARKYNLAVVVTNQVSDRFSDNPTSRNAVLGGDKPSSSSNGTRFPESPLASRGPPPTTTTTETTETTDPPSSILDLLPPTPYKPQPPSPPDGQTPNIPATINPQDWAQQLQLDHQQCFFTGWGDNPDTPFANKTPSLGLVWSTQISARLALIKLPLRGPGAFAPLGSSRTTTDGGGGGGMLPIGYDPDEWERDDDGTLVPRATSSTTPLQRKTWRRWMKVVFAGHTKGSGQGIDGAVEYEVCGGGIRGVRGA